MFYNESEDFQKTLDIMKKKADSRRPYFPKIIDWSDKQFSIEGDSIANYLRQKYSSNKSGSITLTTQVFSCKTVPLKPIENSTISTKNQSTRVMPIPNSEPPVNFGKKDIEKEKKLPVDYHKDELHVKIIYETGETFYKGNSIYDEKTGMVYPVGNGTPSEAQFCVDECLSMLVCDLLYKSGNLMFKGIIILGEANDFKGEIMHESTGNTLYKGYFKDGLPQGLNSMVYRVDGSLRYQCDFNRGFKQGDGKWFNKDGSVRYEGKFINNGIDGKDICLYYNAKMDKIFEGKASKGILDEGSLYYRNRKLLYKGKFAEGAPAGEGKVGLRVVTFLDSNRNASRFKGKVDVADWKISGYGEEYWPNSKAIRYRGNFLKGKKHQKKAELFSELGDRDFLGDIEDDVPHGYGQTFFLKYRRGGVHQQGIFVKGWLTDNLAEEFYESGEIYFRGGMVNS